jgi:hypothetical protein
VSRIRGVGTSDLSCGRCAGTQGRPCHLRSTGEESGKACMVVLVQRQDTPSSGASSAFPLWSPQKGPATPAACKPGCVCSWISTVRLRGVNRSLYCSLSVLVIPPKSAGVLSIVMGTACTASEKPPTVPIAPAKATARTPRPDRESRHRAR